MPTELLLPKSAKDMLPAALHFMYAKFAAEILNIEESLEYWHAMSDTATDIGRINRCYEEISELEMQLRKLYEVAGMLGMSKDILDQVQHEEMIEQLERKAL